MILAGNRLAKLPSFLGTKAQSFASCSVARLLQLLPRAQIPDLQEPNGVRLYHHFSHRLHISRFWLYDLWMNQQNIDDAVFANDQRTRPFGMQANMLPVRRARTYFGRMPSYRSGSGWWR
jgi:hypothetical protein